MHGSDYKVEKLECTNHVSKTVYTRLKTIRDACKGKKLSDGKTIWDGCQTPT